jgi:arylsulfatase A
MATFKKTLFVMFLVGAIMACDVRMGEEQLNVLLIITDDQGWGDLSFHGNEFIETPHIDVLAKQSVAFDRFYVSPVCAPTRASLLTGRYHIATGTTWVTHRMEVMREEEVTIAELLKPHGYVSGLFGKWHQGKQFPHDPIGQGFDEFFGFSEGHLNNYFDTKLTHNFEEVRTSGYLPDVLTDKTIDFMEKEDSFFAMLSLNTPHSPFQVPDHYFDKYTAKGLDDKDACVYGMIENIDDNIGRLMAYLEESSKIENTIVIFMTDNGPNGVRFNGGMKGKKADLDEGGVRVPFFMKIPGYEPNLIKPLAGHIDILPTLADFLGIEMPHNLDIHGKSLKPLIEGEKNWEDRYFFTHHVHLQFDTLPGAIRNQEYLLTLKNQGKELYHLFKDPLQKENIIQNELNLATEMENKYMSWLEAMTVGGVEPPLIQIGHPGIQRVELPAPEGKRFGGVAYQGEMGWANDWFVGFRSNADKVSWELLVVEEAEYEILVELTNAKPFDLQFSVNAEAWSIPILQSNQAQDIPSPDRVKRTEVYEKNWPLVSLGKKRFKKGKVLLTLNSKDDDITLLEIKSLILSIDRF